MQYLLLYGFYILVVTATFGGAFYGVDIVEWFKSRWSHCPKCHELQKVLQIDDHIEVLNCEYCHCRSVRRLMFVQLCRKTRANYRRGRWREQASPEVILTVK